MVANPRKLLPSYITILVEHSILLFIIIYELNCIFAVNICHYSTKIKFILDKYVLAVYNVHMEFNFIEFVFCGGMRRWKTVLLVLVPLPCLRLSAKV